MKRSQIFLVLCSLLWAFSIGLGLYLLMNHEVSPGKPGAPPVKWPKDSNIKLSSDKDTLVMFVHPQCPCTKASLEQLTPLTKTENLAIKILVFSPRVKPKDWRHNAIDQLDFNKSSVSIIPDCDGFEAIRFNSQTSGQTLLYDTNGQLVFAGGITGARGKTGINPGLIELCTALSERTNKGTNSQKAREALVFGCSIIKAPSK